MPLSLICAINLYFITENFPPLIKALTSLEETKSQLADVKQYLHAGISKSTFGLENRELFYDLI